MIDESLLFIIHHSDFIIPDHGSLSFQGYPGHDLGTCARLGANGELPARPGHPLGHTDQAKMIGLSKLAGLGRDQKPTAIIAHHQHDGLRGELQAELNVLRPAVF
jgi:hypothetical protein